MCVLMGRAPLQAVAGRCLAPPPAPPLAPPLAPADVLPISAYVPCHQLLRASTVAVLYAPACVYIHERCTALHSLHWLAATATLLFSADMCFVPAGGAGDCMGYATQLLAIKPTATQPLC